MDKSTAETIVKVYAILLWIAAFFVALGALGFLFMSSFMGGAFGGAFTMMAPAVSQGMMGQALVGGTLVGIGMALVLVLLAAIAVAYAHIGRGLWLREPWARTGALVVAVISLLSFPFGTILGAFGIWLFGFEPAVKGLFGKTAAKKKR